MSEEGEKSVNDEEKKTQDVGVRYAKETEMIRAEGDA